MFRRRLGSLVLFNFFVFRNVRLRQVHDLTVKTLDCFVPFTK